MRVLQESESVNMHSIEYHMANQTDVALPRVMARNRERSCELTILSRAEPKERERERERLYKNPCTIPCIGLVLNSNTRLASQSKPPTPPSRSRSVPPSVASTT